jgi:hypothetical protein
MIDLCSARTSTSPSPQRLASTSSDNLRGIGRNRHWHDFFGGERWRDVVYGADLLPLGCSVVDVEVELLGANLATIGQRNHFGAAVWNGTGAWIVGRTIGSRSLAVTVESYFDASRAVRYRLRHFVQGTGGRCRRCQWSRASVRRPP